MARDVTELSATSKNGFLHAEKGDFGPQAEREVRWLTPKSVVAALGHFDLDPCGAPGWDLADRTYLPENDEDGRTLPWEGRVWLNPPYGARALPFMQRMAEHQRGTALIFARTDTALIHEWVFPYASALLFLRGRITFLDDKHTPAKANSGAPSMLVSYGDEDMAQLWWAPLAGKRVLL